jgi:hypothetical protein
MSAVASDKDLFNQVQSLAKVVERPEFRIPDEVFQQLPEAVQREMPSIVFQPDFEAIGKIQALLRRAGLDVSVYETCELNRLFVDNPTVGNMDALVEYWNALGDFTAGRTGNQEFMALIGAMAMDKEFRFDFTENQKPLTDIGFHVSEEDEVKLRELLAHDGTADLRARAFRDDSWSGQCEQIAKPYAGWVHFNV